MTQEPQAFFRRDGDSYAPTGLGLSPWDKRSQNGVSLAGLMAHVLETTPAQGTMLMARMTTDIMGAVPMEPLTPAVRVLRDGPRMQLIEAELQGSGRTWVRTSALRVRLGDSPGTSRPATHPLRDDAPVSRDASWCEVVHMRGGGFGVPGAGAMWIRIKAEVVEGEPLTALQRVAMIADFGSGIAPVVSFKEWTSANLDIVLNMTRAPQGEWLLIDATSESAGNGIGVATGNIGDTQGMFATTLQTLFLNRR